MLLLSLSRLLCIRVLLDLLWFGRFRVIICCLVVSVLWLNNQLFRLLLKLWISSSVGLFLLWLKQCRRCLFSLIFCGVGLLFLVFLLVGMNLVWKCCISVLIFLLFVLFLIIMLSSVLIVRVLFLCVILCCSMFEKGVLMLLEILLVFMLSILLFFLICVFFFLSQVFI